MKTVPHTDDVQPFVYKCALHFEKTRLHKMLSLMRALWGRMRIPPWLKMRFTGAEVAGTQYNRIDIWQWAQTFEVKLIIVNDGVADVYL